MNQTQEHMKRTTPQTVHCVRFRDVNWMQLAMLEPCKQPNGRGATRVYYQDGSYDHVAHSCEFLLKHLAYFYHTDLQYVKALARECSPHAQRRKSAYWFDDNCCLIPVKCKAPTTDAAGPDSALGYVVMQHLWQYKRLENNNTLILFGPQHKGVEITQRTESMRNLVGRAHNLRACHELRQLKEQMAAEAARQAQGHIGHYWD